MFFVQLPPNTTCPLKVRVLELSPRDTNLTSATQHLLEVNDSGWHQLLLGPEAQTAYSQGHLALELAPEGQEAWSPVILAGAAHRPFVTARVRVGASTGFVVEASTARAGPGCAVDRSSSWTSGRSDGMTGSSSLRAMR